jgi:hypothetical protein
MRRGQLDTDAHDDSGDADGVVHDHGYGYGDGRDEWGEYGGASGDD